MKFFSLIFSAIAAGMPIDSMRRKRLAKPVRTDKPQTKKDAQAALAAAQQRRAKKLACQAKGIK